MIFRLAFAVIGLFIPAIAPLTARAEMRAAGLSCEYRMNPVGIDATHPRLGWQLQSEARGQRQTAYEVLVASTALALRQGKGDLWDSGRVESDNSTNIAYAGRPLASGEQVWWTVRVWDKSGKLSAAAPIGFWQMGLLHAGDWKAQWIAADTPRDAVVDGSTLPPCPYLRRTFTVAKQIKRATVYATARGVYELHLNGAKVGDAVLAPGWTDYRKRIEYQTYDVTGSLRQGSNTIGAILGGGWYSGYVGFGHRRGYYGNIPELKLQLEIDHVDGTRQIVTSDGSWRARTGAIVYSDLLQGESYDSRLEIAGWDLPGVSDLGWSTVVTNLEEASLGQADVTAQVAAMVGNNALSVVASNDIGGDPALDVVKALRVEYTLGGVPHSQTVPEHSRLQIPGASDAGAGNGALVIRRAVYGVIGGNSIQPALTATKDQPVRVTQHLPARRITQPTPGTYIFDLGQNMVGWARLRVNGAAGTRVRLRFGEMLNPDGTLYTANLRSAQATDTYLCRGGGLAVWEPRFTFHGFRYVEVTGYPGAPPSNAVTGCVIGSDTPVSGTFACSSPLVNQLQHNIVWGQRGNFVSVPTDCPQRDERLGWMGDAQIFARTATYNRDVAAFYENWMDSVDEGQSAEGGFSDVSPRAVDDSDGAPAWGDAGIIVPWTVYQAYGDTGILAAHWPAMTRWMHYITSANSYGLWQQRRNNDFGDWLSIQADTPKEVLATSYYAYDAELMAQMARASGRADEAAKYEALFERIKTAYNAAYVAPNGRIQGDTQTVYVLALRFHLLPPKLQPLAAKYLVENIAAKNGHLSTGFVGVGYLCPVLTESGHDDVAHHLLLNTTFPSWGYSIKQGATTIWERWDGWTVDKGFQDPGMNSFNHYSLGSVGQWLYQDVAGIDTDPDQPGYKHILLRPHPGGGLSWASATYDSIRGPIVSRWRVTGGRLRWHIEIPANTTATVRVPTDQPGSVRESGRAVGLEKGIKAVGEAGGFAVYEVPSGSYDFTASVIT